MAEVKWIKIVTDIFDDDKILLIESMPEADALIVIWFKLLCLAGKQNNSGVFLLNGRIAYTDEMFATIFRRNINTVRLALKTFEEFGMIEVINNTVTIPNWEKHQKLDAMEMARDKNRERVARWREKQKLLLSEKTDCNVTGNVTGNVTDDVTVTHSNAHRIDKIREDKIREDKKESEKRKRFTAPTVDEVEAYAKEKGYTGFSADRFVDYYESKGWLVGKTPMKDWKAAVRGWVARDSESTPKPQQKNPALDYAQREYKDEDFSDLFINLDEYGEV